MKGESLWPRLAALPLVIEACEYERLHAVLACEFERVTTHVRLVGAEDPPVDLPASPLTPRPEATGFRWTV